MTHKTNWFSDCKWGVNIVFTVNGGAATTAADWNDRVDGFDCQGLAARISTEFVIGYTEQVTRNQGVVTWDVPADDRGRIRQPYLDMRVALAAAVPPGQVGRPPGQG